MNTNRTIIGPYGSNTPKIFQMYAVSIGTSPTQIIGVGISEGSMSASYNWRSGLTFHNPGGTFDVFICQATDANGDPIVPTVNGAGTIIVMRGATFQFDLPVAANKAWLGIAAGPAVLTVLEYIS